MAPSPAIRLAAVFLVLVTVGSSLAVFAVAPAAAYRAPAPAFAVSTSHGVNLVAGPAAHPNPAVSYPIFFYETGLPSGINWQITVGHATSNYVTDGNTDSLAFSDPNGVYAYSIQDISGWHQSNLSYHGNVVVSGASVTEPTLSYSQVTYAVQFSEMSLPSGKTFQVTLGGNPTSLVTDGSTDTLAFNVPNGTYSYAILDISGWHQGTLPYTGHVTVTGSGVTETTLNYVQVTYSVTFQESGIGAGQTWQVTVNSVVKSLTTNGATDALSWSGLPNGTYAYAIQDIAGWHEGTLPYHGSVVVAGSSVTESTLVYFPVTYSVVFTEVGLPAGETFQVSVGRTGESLLTDGHADSLYFTAANGTYSYTVTGISGWHQSNITYTGSLVITGAPLTEPTLEFLQVNYSVTFTESGLPAATVWAVTLNGQTLSSNGTMIAFSEPNGTYGDHIDYVAGYQTTPSSSSVVVAGADRAISVPFTQVTYTLSFSESTLPSGTHWSVTVGVTSHTSTGTSIAFTLPNGTYGYSIGFVSGYVPTVPSGSASITGASTVVAVSFTQVQYTLTFTATGFPATGHPKVWSVSLDGTLQTTSTSSISFAVANGTHTYLVRGPAGWRVSSVLPPEGSIVINGESASQAVTFVRGGTGTVTFHEVGLAVATRWCVTLGSLICSTTPKILSKNLTPGAYSYVINTFHGVDTVVTIHGASVGTSGGVALAHGTTVKVRFAYAVTFTESGLPFSTSWKVVAGGQTVISTSTTITLYLTNGTYTFHVGHISGYTAAPGSGGLHVAGSNLAVSIRFSVAR